MNPFREKVITPRRQSEHRCEEIGSCPSSIPLSVLSVYDQGTTYINLMLYFEHESEHESENES